MRRNLLFNDFEGYEDLLNECDYVNLEDMNNTVVSKSDLSIYQLNIRSLLHKFTNLKNTINLLENKNIFLDLISLCETHLTDLKEPLCELNGYKLESNNRKQKKGGGVCIYVRDTYKYVRRNDLEIFLEGRLESCIVEIVCPKKNVILCSLYRPPSGSLLEFNRQYKQLLAKIKSERKEIVMSGDFNIDLLKLDKNKASQEFLDSSLECKLLPTVTKPTRVTHSTATLIDNVFLSENLTRSYKTILLTDDISDHVSVVTSLQNRRVGKKTKRLKIETRDVNPSIVQLINKDLMETDWDFLHPLDTNTAFNMFHNNLQRCIDKHAPIKTFYVSQKKRIRDPWITSGMRKLSLSLSNDYKKLLKQKKIPSDCLKYREK